MFLELDGDTELAQAVDVMYSSRKYPYSPTEGIGISWRVRGSVRPKNLKKCRKLNRNFQWGGGDFRKNTFRGGGMDIFSNYTLFPQNIVFGVLSVVSMTTRCGKGS